MALKVFIRVKMLLKQNVIAILLRKFIHCADLNVYEFRLQKVFHMRFENVSGIHKFSVGLAIFHVASS